MRNQIISLYRPSRRNVGDWHSAPARYFPALDGPTVDIWLLKKNAIMIDGDVIVGGGGMFTPPNKSRFNRIQLTPGRRMVGWGIGENRHFKKNKDWLKEQPFKLPDWAHRCELLGVRDWNCSTTSVRWVPCASCMHSGYTNKASPIHDIVIFEHKQYPIDIPNFPKRSNDDIDINETLAFLASGRVVITSSYHGAFWATLLGRAVVAFPFSTKFYGLRHRPVLSRPDDWKKSVERAVAYPQALTECRNATISFSMDVFKLLGLDSTIDRNRFFVDAPVPKIEIIRISQREKAESIKCNSHLETESDKISELAKIASPEKFHSKIVLKFPSFLGDQVVFTGALRALHKSHPGRFITAINIKKDIPLLENNPYISKFNNNDSNVRIYTESSGENFRNHKTSGKHCIEAFTNRLASMLGIKITIDEIRGDVHLSNEERTCPPAGLKGCRYWVIVAGCKKNVPIKGWGTVNYQAVVDALAGKIHFVQCGSRQAGWHPPLRNATNLVGKTSVRDLFRTIYHADGVLCPITSMMHLAAAIPSKLGDSNPRACVVLAGGREPASYITYPGHIVLTTLGMLPCSIKPCGHSSFAPKGGCKRPITLGSQQVPECMNLISPSKVVAAILHFNANSS